MPQFLLIVAGVGACLFWVLQERPYIAPRPYIKAVMAICLGLYCFIVPHAPIIAMTTGFLLCAIGDFALDLPEDKGFLPGLGAFLLGHIAFCVFLWPFATWAPMLCAVIALFSAGFFLWLRPALDAALRLPVLFYSGIIALMGMTAFTTDLSSPLIPLGAGLFIASDVVLAVQRFKREFPFGMSVNWVLYASGQICLALGAVGSQV